MLELKIRCQDADEARLYLNATQYHHLLTDFYNALHDACKHGKPSDILKQVDAFLPELARAVDHNTGPY